MKTFRTEGGGVKYISSSHRLFRLLLLAFGVQTMYQESSKTYSSLALLLHRWSR